MLVTLFGIVMDARLEQSEKTSASMIVTLFGIMTDARLEQYEYLLLVDYQYYTL